MSNSVQNKRNPVSFSVLRSGSAHYHCAIRVTGSTVLVKNPRSELYEYARAQAADGNECTTNFQLNNQVIEISECDVVSNFYCTFPSSSFADESTFFIRESRNNFSFFSTF